MNGPNSMYKIRPIIKLAEEIDLPKCMYKMKVIQNSHSESIKNSTLESKIMEKVNKFLKMPLPEVAALELRQEIILSQLAELKEQLTALRGELKRTCVTNTCPISDVNEAQWKQSAPKEIVINANPAHPPYSLLAFNCLTHNTINIHSYVHSSIKSIPENLKQFDRTTLKYPALNIRLIWKNVSDLELLVCPTKHSVICGEVNLLRFLSRIGPLYLDYEISSSVLEAEVCDEVLDICYKLVRETTVKSRLALLRILGTYLQKCQFFVGASVTVADIAVWSALKQMGFSTKELTANMNKWLAICNEKFCVNST